MNLDTLDPARGLTPTRAQLIEQDLDSDTEGSLAEAIGDLRDDLNDLRAIVEEHALGRTIA